MVMVGDVNQPPRPISWWKTSSFKIYTCHTISSWGDRMWAFAVGLYLIILFPNSLVLPAIYGLANSLSCILLAPYLGGWVDRTKRITAAKWSVIVQNSAVVVGAALIAFTLQFETEIKAAWNGHLVILIYGLIILIAIIAELASIANKIALEKDWIVVLAGGDSKKLARLNAVMRTINLTTLILAPILVGQLIEFWNGVGTALVIGVWNVFSGIMEYSLLLNIYDLVPQLRDKDWIQTKKKSDKVPFAIEVNSPSSPSSSGYGGGGDSSPEESQQSLDAKGRSLNATTPQMLTPSQVFEDVSLVTPVPSKGDIRQEPQVKKPGKSWSQFYHGWKRYLHHHVFFAGLGLACLYMTVLGFDSITVGFLYTQGVDGSAISIIMAIGAVFGILGSVSFPFLRKKLGKNRTGFLGFSTETLALVLCVVSVYMLGSPFEPSVFLSRFTSFAGSVDADDDEEHKSLPLKDLWDNKFHVFLLVLGIVLARFGLWVADLSVTQIFQEEIEESQRGIVNGVQDSFNQFMNLLKFGLVVLLPAKETFGLLVFISWAFVFLGTVSFLIFAKKDRNREALYRSMEMLELEKERRRIGVGGELQIQIIPSSDKF